MLAGLRTLPSQSPGAPFDAHASVFSSLLFSHLLRNTEATKRLAREVQVSDSPEDKPPAARPSADGSGVAAAEEEQEEEEERTGLVHVVMGNLMMAQREQSQLASANNAGVGGTAGSHFAVLGEWSRVMVGYLMVLCVWMWESPRSVREFLEEGSNLQVVS